MGREELIEHLQDLARELGKPPTTEDMHEHGQYSAQAYYYYFDTWEETLEAAGLESTKTTRSDLAEDLQRIQETVGNPSSWADAIREYGNYPLSQIYSKFGDIDSALDAADINKEERSLISKEEITAEITRLATDGTPPTAEQMDAEGAFSARTCGNRFGTWNDAVRAAGYEPLGTSTEYSDEELLNEIECLAGEFGRPPTTREMIEHGKYTASVYFRRFDSWNDAVIEAGFIPHEDPPEGVDQRIPTAELLNEIETVADEVGGRPTTESMLEYGAYSITPYVRRFGSWNNALERAGFSPFTGTTEDLFTRDELLAEIQRVGQQVDRPPTTEQMTDLGKYSPSPYQHVFGSWVEALKEAGYEPTTHQLRRYNP
jgi:nucleotide-binding universal stress UspA family protein